MEFSPGDVEALLGDAEVAALAETCVAALRDGALAPLAEALRAGAPVSRRPQLVRKAAFAAAIQGLSPRLSRLPGSAELPGEFAARLEREAERCAERGHRIVERLGEVLALLASEGIDAVPLKGAALVLRGEADPALRPMGDLDLLVTEPARVPAAAAVLARKTGYRTLLDTPRHLVLAEEGESVPGPGGEHPGNPLRIELHRSFRLPVLGVVLDATEELARDAERVPVGFQLPSPRAMLRHLWHHAAEDYAAKGLRGIQAVDFLDRARRTGPLAADLGEGDAHAAAPLLYAADALERLFPGTFEAASLERLAARVPPALRAQAATLAVLRHSRPARGFTRTALGLAPGPASKARLLFRNAFPTLGEVKANVAPEAEGVALKVAWLRVLTRRAAGLLH